MTLIEKALGINLWYHGLVKVSLYPEAQRNAFQYNQMKCPKIGSSFTEELRGVLTVLLILNSDFFFIYS